MTSSTLSSILASEPARPADRLLAAVSRSRPLRILYHHRTLGDGAEGIHVREMVQALRRLGHDVRVTALVGDTSGAAPAPRLSRLAGIVPPAAYELAEIGCNVVSRVSLAAAVRRFRPHVIYDRYNTYSTAAVAVGRARGIPVFLEVNAPIAYERTAYEHHRLRMPSVAVKYERWICGAADHVFTVSAPLARFLRDHRGLDPARITVIPNGANPSTFAPDRPPQFSAGGRLVLGFVGILRPWHGVDLFLDAVVALLGRRHDVHALIVGDGPMEPVLQRLVADARIQDRVTFTGRVPHDAVRDYVASMDVAVSPRATFYASPMKIVEYMAMARPVVAPDMENIRELIDDGRTGLLFAPDDWRDLVRCIELLITSPERRRAIGNAARREVEQRLNWDANARIVAAKAREAVAAPECQVV